MYRVSLTVGFLMALVGLGLAQTGTRNGEWRRYGGDSGSTKYAPLDQTNKDNVSRLQIAWRVRRSIAASRPECRSSRSLTSSGRRRC